MTFPSVREPAVELEKVWGGDSWREWGEPLPAPKIAATVKSIAMQAAAKRRSCQPFTADIGTVLTDQWQSVLQVRALARGTRTRVMVRLRTAVEEGRAESMYVPSKGMGGRMVLYRRRT